MQDAAPMATSSDAPILGSGDLSFRPAGPWPHLPPHIALGEVAAVAVDDRDRVYLFNRSPDPVVVVETDGTFINAWGQGVFPHPHGLHFAADGCLYCTDDDDHTVRKCTPQGRVLLELGMPGRPAAPMSGRPFCRCCHTALSPSGDIYVADGYGNARVHKFDPAGRHLFSWGSPGTGEGEFNLPHNICCDDDGWVYVADRENHRIQIFDGNGRYEAQIVNLHRASALTLIGRRCPVCVVGELGPYLNVNRGRPNLGPRISIMDHRGKLLSRIGAAPAAGQAPGQFYSPHGIAMDSRGDLYVGEVSFSAWPSLFPNEPRPADLRFVQKLIRVPSSAA